MGLLKIKVSKDYSKECLIYSIYIDLSPSKNPGPGSYQLPSSFADNSEDVYYKTKTSIYFKNLKIIGKPNHQFSMKTSRDY